MTKIVPVATIPGVVLCAIACLAQIPDRVPGVVIDHVAASTHEYVGSPSLAVLPNGEYLASHDRFGAGGGNDHTFVFASTNRGKTWTKRATIAGQFWSNLFVHGGTLFLMGTSREYGQPVIRRSLDGGRTWTEPKDNSTGLLRSSSQYHCAPVPVVVHDGRVWRAMEDAMGPDGWGHHFRSMMMSAPVGSDWLDARNWTSTAPLGRNPAWLNGRFGGWLEGNAVVGPDGSMVNMLRVDDPRYPEKTALIHIDKDGTTSKFNPDADFVEFPGGCKKFTVRYDAVSKHYWSLVNWVPPAFRNHAPGSTRNTLALTCSTDLRRWEIRAIVLHHPDIAKHGFQYADWVFDGKDIIAVVRTAYDDGFGGANNYHDANYLTFHRIAGFRHIRKAGL